MCTGKCAKCIGVSLYPLTVLCILANIFLLFPGLEIGPVSHPGDQLTQEVLFLGGVIGGGILVLIPAIHIQATGREGCCNNRCGMFLSILFAAIGVVGSVYCFAVSIQGMVRGPKCEYLPPGSINTTWGQPFYGELKTVSNISYLFNTTSWDDCIFPPNVVVYNITLFSIALIASGVEIVLCAVQMFNGLFGCLCGTCRGKE
ncbi:transmembrane 4 L6 family member 5-like [Pelodytes ibericus]